MRVILHCDLNNFFASVACRQNPALRGHPVAVCGNPEQRKGIVLAKNEPAKKLGVKTGMVIWQAKRLCPDLVVVPPDYPSYAAYSKKVQAIYYRYTNQVEPFGIDECWLDVSASQKLFGDGAQMAEQIRATVKKELGLTVSIGVSFNKTYAKLGSDLAAPDSVLVIDADNYQKLIYPLPLANLLFVGKQTQALLAKLNLHTIGSLSECDPAWLATFLGVNATKLIAAARGDEHEPIADYDAVNVPKSVGNGTTLPRDLVTSQEVEQIVYLLAEKVAHRLRKQNLRGSTVSLAVKGVNLAWSSAQQTVTPATNLVPVLRQTAMQIFDRLWGHGAGQIAPVRALRLAVSNLTNQNITQTDLFQQTTTTAKQEALANVFAAVRAKYGPERILLGGTPQSYHALGYTIDFEECDDLPPE